jgi:hypothetical protein
MRGHDVYAFFFIIPDTSVAAPQRFDVGWRRPNGVLDVKLTAVSVLQQVSRETDREGQRERESLCCSSSRDVQRHRHRQTVLSVVQQVSRETNRERDRERERESLCCSSSREAQRQRQRQSVWSVVQQVSRALYLKASDTSTSRPHTPVA